MTWLLDLYKAYESNSDAIGVIEKKSNGQEYTLLPVAHTTQNAHIEVQVTVDGEFHSASVIEKKDTSTLIPATESSSNRAGSIVAPYPLHDKLSYVAGDFMEYSGNLKKKDHYQRYIEQLKEWVNSPFAHPKVNSIYLYLEKKHLIRDLVEENILFLDAEGNLIESWGNRPGEKPAIFATGSIDQESAFVRFTVHSPGEMLSKVWKDQEVYDSFINFYKEKLNGNDLCYITGEWLPGTVKHANKIRNAADKAKLISANDDTGFTFRGRFTNSSEVASISYDVSQKAHNALKWLINRQGKIIDQRLFLVWGNDQADIPDPQMDTFSLSSEIVETAKRISFTNAEYAHEIAKALDGYKNNLQSEAKVSILILDSATTGRLAVLYYRNLDKDIYLDKLKKWHSTCIWRHRYRKDENGESVQFYGAPAPKDIAFAAYGPRVNDKIVKGVMERMLPSIIDDRKIPLDIVKSALTRASNPVSMDGWEWEKTLSIACSLINKEEGFEVGLDTEIHDRDYLFGRLLAIADVLERRALGSEEGRSSNAIRYMNSFSRHPARTWKTIQDSLQPYQARLGAKGLYLSKMIDDVASRISFEDFNNKPLSGKYLLGFYSQRHALYQKKEEESEQTKI